MITMFPFFDFDNKFQTAPGEAFDSEQSDSTERNEFAELLAAACPAPPEILPAKIAVEQPDLSVPEKIVVEQPDTPAFEKGQNFAFDSLDQQPEMPEIAAPRKFASVFADSEVLNLTTPNDAQQTLDAESLQPSETLLSEQNPSISKFDAVNWQQPKMPEPEIESQKEFETILQKPLDDEIPAAVKTPQPRVEKSVQQFDSIPQTETPSIPNFDSFGKQKEMPEAAASNNSAPLFAAADNLKAEPSGNVSPPQKEETVQTIETSLGLEQLPPVSEQDFSIFKPPLSENDFQIFTPPPFPKQEAQFAAPPNVSKDKSPLLENTLPLLENTFQIFASEFAPKPDTQVINIPQIIVENNLQSEAAAPKISHSGEIDLPELNEAAKVFIAPNLNLESGVELESPEMINTFAPAAKTVESKAAVSFVSKSAEEVNPSDAAEANRTTQNTQEIESEPETTHFAEKETAIFSKQPEILINDASFSIISDAKAADKQVFAVPPIKNQKETSENGGKIEINPFEIKVETPEKINPPNVSRIAAKEFSPFESQPTPESAGNFQTNYKTVVNWLKTAVTRESQPNTEITAPRKLVEKTVELPEKSVESIKSNKTIATKIADANVITENFPGNKKIFKVVADFQNAPVKFPQFKNQPSVERTLFQSPPELNSVEIEQAAAAPREIFISKQKSEPVQTAGEITFSAAPDFEKPPVKTDNQPIAAKAEPETETLIENVPRKPEPKIEISPEKNEPKIEILRAGNEQKIEIPLENSKQKSEGTGDKDKQKNEVAGNQNRNQNLNPESFISVGESFPTISDKPSPFINNFQNSMPALRRVTAEIRNSETARIVENIDFAVENPAEIKPFPVSEKPQIEPQITVNYELNDKKPLGASISPTEIKPPKKSKAEEVDLKPEISPAPLETKTGKIKTKTEREFIPILASETASPPLRPQVFHSFVSMIKETTSGKEAPKPFVTFQPDNLSGAETQIENSGAPEAPSRLITETALGAETPPTEQQITIDSGFAGNETPIALSSFAERVLPKKSKTGNADLNVENTLSARETIVKFGVKAAPEMAASRTASSTPPVHEQVLEGLITAMKETALEKEPRKIRLRLRPEDLGGVEIQIENSNPQEIKARFITDTDAARVVLSENIKQLNESLQAAGWNIARLEIVCRDSSNNASAGHGQNHPPADQASDKNLFRQRAETTAAEQEAQPERLLSVRA